MSFHAKMSQGGPNYPIIASNIGLIGKPADASDLAVINTGNPLTAIDAKGARVESKLVLQDAAGNTLGAFHQNNVTLTQKQNIFDPIVLAPPVWGRQHCQPALLELGADGDVRDGHGPQREDERQGRFLA